MNKLVPLLPLLLLLTGVLCGLAPKNVQALGLGSINMRSTLNQPLDAKIDLLRVRSGEIDNLKVSLASNDTFQRAGIDRPAFLTKLKFDIVRPPGVKPYIRISSAQPITEPFLNFLIEVTWANGRLLREFTVLVDPPVLTGRRSAPVEAPVIEEFEPEPEIPSRPAPVSPKSTAQFDAPPEWLSSKPEPAAERAWEQESFERPFTTEPAGGLEYGRVKRGDTLWEIALKMRKDKSVNVAQLMLALLEHNPEAFFDNNINNLKMGYVLRLDNISQIADIGPQEASRIVDLQWEQFKQSRSIIGSTPSRTRSTVASTVPVGARVKLLTPGSDTASPDDVGAPGSVATDGAGKTVPQLREELSLAQETLDSSRGESKELTERLAALEEQVTTMRRLVMLKDDQLMALQNQLKEAGQEPELALAAEGLSPDDMAAYQQDEAAELLATPEASQSSGPGGFGSGLAGLSDLLFPGLIVLAVLMVIGWLYVRRRKMQQFQESILTGQSSIVGGADVQLPISEDASFMSDFAVSSMDGIQTEVTEVDPVSEADVYMAYGRYKQAEELINEAVEKDSNRVELKLKLLEIHFAAKDKEAFDLQAEIFHDALGGEHHEMWNKVVEMGRELSPGNALFSEEADSLGIDTTLTDASGGGAADLDKMNLEETIGIGTDLNFDAPLDKQGLTGLGEEGEMVEEGQTAESDTDGLDFDFSSLDFEETGSADVEDKAQDAGQQSEVANSLDFDLGTTVGAGAPGDSNSKGADNAVAAVEAHAEDGLIDFSMAEQGVGDHGLDFTMELGSESPQGQDVASNVTADVAERKSDIAGQDTVTEGGDEGSLDLELTMGNIESELDESLFADLDEVGTKIDLARAYIDMGDSDGARSILGEVVEEGNDNQKQEAEELIQQIG